MTGSLETRCASEIELERVKWLWPGRLARGKHTSIGGDPGGGKSNLGMYIAATVSTAGEWPCGEGRSPRGSVLILNAEDGAGDTIVPRLHAANADCGRVHIVSAVRTDESIRGFNLQADIALLEQKIAELGDVALIIIDPVSSYLGRTDSHRNAEVRAVLEPLSAMAERTRVAVLSITHFSKAGASTGSKALHRFIGSIAFVGAPRIAFAVIEDADDKDRRLLLHAKNNLAAQPQGLAFRVQPVLVGGDQTIMASCVNWETEPVTITANEALAAEAGGKCAKPKCRGFPSGDPR
jgi:predicted ATP-dependent serine protease